MQTPNAMDTNLSTENFQPCASPIIAEDVEPLFFGAVGRCLFFALLLLFLVSQNTQDIEERQFWFDEIVTLEVAQKPFWKIPKITVVTSDHNQPPIFYLISHFAAKIGTDPIILRSVSFICYILMIVFVLFFLHEFRFATRFFFCLVLLLSPFAAYAATEFRPYAIAALSILLSSAFSIDQ